MQKNHFFKTRENHKNSRAFDRSSRAKKKMIKPSAPSQAMSRRSFLFGGGTTAAVVLVSFSSTNESVSTSTKVKQKRNQGSNAHPSFFKTTNKQNLLFLFFLSLSFLSLPFLGRPSRAFLLPPVPSFRRRGRSIFVTVVSVVVVVVTESNRRRPPPTHPRRTPPDGGEPRAPKSRAAPRLRQEKLRRLLRVRQWPLGGDARGEA